MKRLPVGIQSFEKIIENNFVYVDKTKIIYELIDRGVCYFMSRPRRFGKSVLISTLDALFKNKRNLFTGCWIDTSDYRWQEYPVVRIDFSAIARSSAQELETHLCSKLLSIADEYNCPVVGTSLSQITQDVLGKLSKINKVVILIDEYDKPMLDAINNMKLARELQLVLASFYTAIKASDEFIRFVFITGIARISRTSLFSGLNNLNDITYRNEYAQIVGYSPEDLGIFAPHIQAIAQQEGVASDVITARMREWYNGYRFSYTPLPVYNPFCVLRYLESGVLANYWFTSGAPGYLVKLLQEQNYTFDKKNIEELDGAIVSADADITYQLERFPLIPLLLQTGYLTIKEYLREQSAFTVTYPNKEVEQAFLKLFAHEITTIDSGSISTAITSIQQALAQNDFHTVIELLSLFFADIPYDIHIKMERYYQSIFYIVLKLIGAHILVEKRTNIGRIDCVIETPSSIIIAEFKIDGSAVEAINQIKEKKYAQAYQGRNKAITLLGVSFDSTLKNIGEWLVVDESANHSA